MILGMRGYWTALLVFSMATIFSIGLTSPIAHAAFSTPVEIIDSTGDGTNGLVGAVEIATDSLGNVFVGGTSNNVFKITPGGTITEIIDATGDGTNALSSPQLIATDTSGNVFVTGNISNNAFKITTPGTCSTGGTPCTITEIIDATGDGSSALSAAVGVATDTTGNVFVAGQNSKNVFKITTPGTCSTGGTPCTIAEIIDSTGDGAGNTLFQSFGVATDTSGNVFVSGLKIGGGNAFKITTPGTCSTSGTPCTITEIIDTTGDGAGNPLDTPRGIATDTSGNVFVSGSFSSNVFKITTPGTCSTGGTPCTIAEIIDSTGDGAGNPLAFPFTVVTDLSGNVFVVGPLSNNAFEITPGGTITEIIDATGDGAGNTLDTARGIATDTSGNVFVTGNISNNAFKIELTDTDGDGIEDSIDVDPNDAANDNFNDGTTFGNIISGNANLSIIDDLNNGVIISATGNADVSACGIVTITFTAGDQVSLTCGSAIIEVISGTVEILFEGDTIVLSEGESITLQEQSAVGGTSLSIDTTALLVAGAQTISPWLILGVVSAVGIGLAVFTLKRSR